MRLDVWAQLKELTDVVSDATPACSSIAVKTEPRFEYVCIDICT